MIKQHIENNREFYSGLRLIAVPIALQQLITTSLNMVDTLMVGKVSVDAVAAVGVANQYYFLLSMVMFGVYSGGMVYFSQYWGKREVHNIHRLLGFTLILGALMAFIFGGIAAINPEMVIRLFTDSEEAIRLGGQYLRIACFSYPFMIISFGFSTGLRAVEQPKFPMIASLIALSLNTVLNIVLIFGLFGFPELGVVGAAIATVVSRIVEFIIILTFAYKRTTVMNPSIKALLSFDKPLIKMLMITSLPVVINEMFWGLGTTAYMMIYGQINVEAISVMNVVNSIANIFFIAGIGVGNASTVMLGKQLGAGHTQKAIEMAALFTRTCLVVGIISGFIFVFCTPLLLPLYDSFDEQTLNLMKTVMLIFAIGIPFRFQNMLNIVGIFRAGGDTRYAMVLEVGVLWTVGVLGCFIAVTVFNAPLVVVAAIVQFEEMIKVVIGHQRVKSNKWVKTLV